jgi:hypothetical protein
MHLGLAGVVVAHEALLAHQGGWDEILLVIGPIAVVVALLNIAKRRVARHDEGATRDDGPG